MIPLRLVYVDVYVVRHGGTAGAEMEFLLLRRAPTGRCPGAWEAVHGHVEPGETPVEAARRELDEETGLVPMAWYNLSRCESFFLHRDNAVAVIPAFAAVVPPGSEVRLGPEHDDHVWLTPIEARARYSWPRERRALDDLLVLLTDGDAGPLEDVLRLC